MIEPEGVADEFRWKTVSVITGSGILHGSVCQLAAQLDNTSERQWARRGDHFLFVIARLKPTVSIEEARADMNVISHQLAQEYPGNNKDMGSQVIPFKDYFARNVKHGLIVLFAAVGMLLLIACANVANLSMANY